MKVCFFKLLVFCRGDKREINVCFFLINRNVCHGRSAF